MDDIQPPQIALEAGTEAESHDTHIEKRSHEDQEPPQIAQEAGTEALKHSESHHESHEAAAEDEEDRFSQISCGTEATDASEAPSTSSEPDRFKVPKIPGSKSHKKTKYRLSRNDYSLMKNIKDQILNDGRELSMQKLNETYNTRSGKNVNSATFRLMVRSFKRWEDLEQHQIAPEAGTEAESHDTHIEERSHEDQEPPQIAQEAGTEALKHSESHHESHEAAAEDEEDRFSQISCGTEATDASEAPSTSSEPDRFKVPKIPGSKSHKKTKYRLSRNDYSLMKNIKDQILNDGRDLLMQEFNETYNTRSGKNVDAATFHRMVRSFKRQEESSK